MGDGPLTLLCPSASPSQPDAKVIGIVGGSARDPRVSYLRRPLPVIGSILDLAHGVDPREVFRTAAPCAEAACQHFDGTDCTLASRLVALAPTAVDELPHCPIRRNCRWFQQEGRAACERCPQIVTLAYMAHAALRQASVPPGRAEARADAGGAPPAIDASASDEEPVRIAVGLFPET